MTKCKMPETQKNIISQFLLAALLTIISATGVFGEAFERNSPSVWSYRFSGADSSLNATKDHPFWSEDRRAYVPIGELLPGEKVKTRQGVVEFLSKAKIPGIRKVYNLEVYREHNYFVTEDGLLAHNCGEVNVASKGFKTFYALKKEIGVAGENRVWHHIVEQSKSNIEKFTAEQIHNTQNIINLDRGVHTKISAFYSSKQRFTDGLTVRKWLQTKDFQFQYQYGLEIINKFSGK